MRMRNWIPYETYDTHFRWVTFQMNMLFFKSYSLRKLRVLLKVTVTTVGVMLLLRLSPPFLIDLGLVPTNIFTKNKIFIPCNFFQHPEVHFRTLSKDPKLNALNNKMSLLGKDNHLLAAFWNHRCQFEQNRSHHN